jgi:DNA-binding NtrC family response regulator
VSCAALPLTLLESELFGYEKGAFTGAVKFKPGKFELASDGVIFLDEIGDMPLVLQAKLLQVLQDGDFTRLGGTRDVKVNSWVIAATNHDLEKDIKQVLFREDLYYRLNIIRIEIPPLRKRREDIPLLTRHFVNKYEEELKIEEPFTLNTGLSKLFHAYHWPGNVRELSSVILRLMVGDDPEMIKTELLDNIEADGLPIPADFAYQRGDKEVIKPATRFGPDAHRSLKVLKAEATRHIEQKAIMYALNMTGWNKRQTAKMLGISYKALFYKMDNLGIRNPR